MKPLSVLIFILAVAGFSCKLEELEKIDPCAITPPQALFTPDKSSGTVPCTVSFTNNSQNAVQFSWDFGDGTFSSLSAPTHVYDKVGNFTVTLVAEDAEGCSATVSQVINVNAALVLPVAAFTFDLGADNGYAPAKVKFTNTSTNGESFLWTFSDGNTSTEASPLHEYKFPGEYTVLLKATNAYGSNQTSKTVSIKPIKFEQFFGGNGDEVGTSVKQTSDGGYIVVGIQDPTASNDQALMLKYNRFGAKEWESNYSGAYDDDLNDVVESSISGYYAVGNSRTNSGGWNDDILVMRRNLDGSGGFERFIGGTNDEVARAILPVSGGFLVAGYTSPTNTVHKKDAYLVKVDYDGFKVWDKTFGGAADDELVSITPTSDGGFVFAGYSEVSGQSTQVYVLKTDNLGNKQWELTYGGTLFDRGERVVEISPGEFLVLGQSTNLQGSDALVLRLTDNVSSGYISWEKRYGKSQVDHINDAVKAADGNIVLVGETIGDSSNGVPDDLYLLKINTDGDFMWEKSWGLPSTFLWGYSVQATSDGGLIITGGGPHGTNSEDVYLVKTDSDGNR